MSRLQISNTGEVSILVASDAKHTGGGLVTFVGWHRLEDLLRRSGELKEYESVDKVTIQMDGINIYIGSHK